MGKPWSKTTVRGHLSWQRRCFEKPTTWNASLANGLQVYGIDHREIPIVSFDVTIPSGRYLGPLAKAGTASLLAQPLMQGTAQKTPAQLVEAIDMLGATNLGEQHQRGNPYLATEPFCFPSASWQRPASAVKT